MINEAANRGHFYDMKTAAKVYMTNILTKPQPRLQYHPVPLITFTSHPDHNNTPTNPPAINNPDHAHQPNLTPPLSPPTSTV